MAKNKTPDVDCEKQLRGAANELAKNKPGMSVPIVRSSGEYTPRTSKTEAVERGKSKGSEQ